MKEIDRLSCLPDSLLLHILSLLPTETCVKRVSLVSHRYFHLWEHLQVLDFYDDYQKEADGQAKLFIDFAIFVNAVLARRRSRDIRKFRLSCAFSDADEFSVPSIATWISTAVGPHLEELLLALFSLNEYGFGISLTLLGACSNLVSLSLCGDIWLFLPQSQHSSTVCLPSLKKLQIDFYYVHVASVNVLLSCCPILEILEVSLSTESLTTLQIPPSLKRLKFTVENDVGACLEIDAPSLKYLRLTRITFIDNAIGNLHKVDEAYLDVFSPPGETVSVDPLLNLLRALSGIKHLVLSCSTTKWLYGTPSIGFGYPQLELPEFCHLLHVELILPCFNLKFMFNVLESCPMLEVLIVEDDQDPSSHPPGLEVLPFSVPRCLMSHLTFIHLKRYRGYSDEKFARYVLREGLVLKTMRISGLSLDLKEKWEKNSILRKFSNTPRGSVSCQLQFD